jgi:hypothetical protein
MGAIFPKRGVVYWGIYGAIFPKRGVGFYARFLELCGLFVCDDYTDYNLVMKL